MRSFAVEGPRHTKDRQRDRETERQRERERREKKEREREEREKREREREKKRKREERGKRARDTERFSFRGFRCPYCRIEASRRLQQSPKLLPP